MENLDEILGSTKAGVVREKLACEDRVNEMMGSCDHGQFFD